MNIHNPRIPLSLICDHLDCHQDHHHHDNHDHQKSDHKGVSIASVIEKFPQNSCAGEEKFHPAPRTKYR